jgi:hypothetical protein
LVGIIKATGNWDEARDTACWWNSANAITALIDYMLVTGDLTYLNLLNSTFNKATSTSTFNGPDATVGGLAFAAAAAAGVAALGWALCDGPCAIAGGIVGAIFGSSPSTDP